MNSLITFLFATLLLGLQEAQAKPFVAVGYGLGSYQDEKKDDVGFTAKGTPAKITLGARSGHIEIETFGRFGTYTGNFTHDGVKNTLEHSEKTFGVGLGIYTIPSLRLNFGYAFHIIKETLKKPVGEIEEEEITDQYGLEDDVLYGPYVGADFHLFTLGPVKFIVSGSAYFVSGIGGKSYEGMASLKIPFDGFSLNTSRSQSDQ